MLIDTPQVVEGSSVTNLTVASGTVDPSNPSIGELFFRTDLNALRTFGGSAWAEAGAVNLNTHTSDNTVHLTSAQNALLDALGASATELNYSVGVTSSIQTQINARTTAHDTHVADLTAHLTSSQNALLDALTASATELNYSVGVTGALQTQLNNIYGTNTNHENRISTLENTTVPAVQTNLNTHAADDAAHLTTAQNTLLDTTISNGITAADIAKLSSASTLSSSIKVLLDGLEANKLALNGSLAMSGNLQMGGFRITGLGTPTAATDAATKDYVDSFVQGLHWVGSARVATTENITLSGLQTVDGVTLSLSDRVLVKNQGTPSENGLYLAASGAWTRAGDYNAILEVNNSAVFVLEGLTQNRSTWVQTSTVSTLGTSPITFSAFSGPVVNSAGPGINLGPNGSVSLIEGAGITIDGANAVVLDVHPAGGLMLTTNNSTAAPITTVAAQLALTNTGVSAGTYQTATQIVPYTVDLKGRITSVGTPTTITPAFSSITGLPTTLSGYGITNAVPIAGGVTMTGSLSWSSGTTISAVAPAGLSSYFSTAAYGVSQGDNKTHFGYNTGSSYVNYIRGVSTTVSGNLIVDGALSAGNASATGGANTFVLRDSNGYIQNNYFNSSDNSVSAGVTGVMVKAGDNYLRTGTAAAVAAFISGQNFNTTGNAATATTASSANSVAWTNVSGRPTALSSFTNDSGYITTSAAEAQYVNIGGDVMTGALGITDGLVGNDPYGRMSVTMSANSNSYSYYGMTRAGQIGWSMGIDTSNRVFFGTGGAGTAANIPSRPLSLSTAGDLSAAGTISTATRLHAGNGNFQVSASGTIDTVQGYTPPNSVMRLTPNLHLNSMGGSAVILNWDNGNGGNAGNLAFRVGNGAGTDVFTLSYAGNGWIAGGLGIGGNISAANITSNASVASRIVQAGGDGHIYNGYYWSSDNGVSSGVTGVMVKQGDNFLRTGTAAAVAAFISGQNFNTTGNAATATNASQLGGVSASGYSRNAVDTWHLSSDGYNRYYYANAGRSYYSSNNGFEFRRQDGTALFTIGNDGNLYGTFNGPLNGNASSASTATLAAKASTLSQGGGNGGAMTFYWAGQSGQPSWLWGGNDGSNMYVYNPSNFVVANTNSISNAVGSAYTWSGVQQYLSGSNTSLGGRAGTLEAYNTNGQGATMSFHRSGSFAINMGLDSDNVFRIGGWSASANRLQMDMSGNLTMAGDVIAYSDRRLKKDIVTIAEPLAKVEALNGVTFTRTDSDEVSVGLIAQDVQAVLPEAVSEDADGILAVKYGNLAGLFVEAIKALNKEVAELRAELKALKDAQ